MKNSKAYVWGLLSRFAPQVIYLATTMVLARLVSPSAFGTIGVLAVIFTVANILLDSGLGGSLIKEREITDIDCSTISVFNLFVSVSIYCILFALAGSIQSYFNIEGLEQVVKTISIVFPITALGIVPLSLLKRTLKFEKIFTSTISSVIIASIISIFIAYKGGDVYALVSYQIIVHTVSAIFNFYFSHYRLSLKFSYSSFRRLIPFGFFTSIVTIVDTVYENIMTMLTGKYLNVQTAGYLYQAKRLEEATSQSSAMAVGIVAFPILTRKKDDLAIFTKECVKTYNTISLLFFPFMMIGAIFSDQIVVLLFGQQWLPSSPYLKILMICGLFIMTEQLMLSFIKSLGKVKNLMYFTLFKRGIGLSLLLICLLINPDFLIYAYLLTTIIGCIVNVVLYTNVTKTSIVYNMVQIVYNMIPPLVLLVFIEVIRNLFGISILLLVLITIVYVVAYYLIYLPIRGINIINEAISYFK